MRGLRRRHGRSMRDIEPGLRGMGTRMAQAEDRFIDNVSRIGGISKAAAAKVLAVYRKHRVVKMNAVSGELSVKHGGFMERAVILRALEESVA